LGHVRQNRLARKSEPTSRITKIRSVSASLWIASVAPTRRPNAELRTREHLTPGEVEALVEAAKANRHGHRDATMILLAFRHGLRAAELCDLRWDQVEFNAGVLHVRRVRSQARVLPSTPRM
jgi:integrase